MWQKTINKKMRFEVGFETIEEAVKALAVFLENNAAKDTVAKNAG